MKQFFLFIAGSVMLLSCNNQPASETKTSDQPATTVTADVKPATPPPVEFTDSKYMDIGKRSLELMAKGDMDAWADMYADNAVYLWSAGDSLAGKPAILKYWKDRRMNLIDSLSYANDIWLPIKINQPQKGPDMPGVWLLGWFQVNVKYKNGQKLSFWTHNDMHFNADGKVDRAISYIDRSIVNAALAKKK